MEAYIEISFITNILICLLSFYASCYFSLSKKNSYAFFILLLLEQLIQINCFNKAHYIYFYIYEFFLYFYLIKNNFKKAIMYICIKYLIIFTCFKFIGGSFHLFHYYVDIRTQMFGIWFLLLLITVLLKMKWNVYLELSDFIYSVHFYTNREFELLGFMDTGNQLTYQNIPVLFVDYKYKDRFVSLPSNYVEVNTINGKKLKKIYLCCVAIKGYKKQSYYVCCEDPIVLEFNCKCLLNIES